MNYRLKKNIVLLNFLILLFLVFASCEQDQKNMDLSIRFVHNTGLSPMISWKTDISKFEQEAYRIFIFKDPSGKKTIWDSGLINSSNQIMVKVDESNLQPGVRYYVKVNITGAESKELESQICTFDVPIQYPNNWDAKWITYTYDEKSPLPIFKKSFEIQNKNQIDHVKYYVSAPGFSESYLNGEKIGCNVLDPGQTNYDDYAYYSAYDISLDELNENNVLGIMLGNGWYNQNVVWGRNMIYGEPVVIAQLVIHYKDGSVKTMGSDESWLWTSGPITYSNIYGGETYDANEEVEDWFAATSEPSKWSDALLANVYPPQVFEQFANPIRRMNTFKLESVQDVNGKYIADFGQNLAGWVKLTVKGEKGQKITMRFAEELDSTGNINLASTGVRATKVVQTSTYICKGEGVEVWEPRFTYHGFRYAEISGLKEKPTAENLEAVVVYSSVPTIGTFQCSEENINKLHELANHTIKGNIHSIPTDCPHRERCGWTGDAHALVRALYANYDAQQFMTKYMLDMRSSAAKVGRELYFGTNFHDRSFIMKPKGVPTMIVPGRRTSGTASPDWGTAMTQVPWFTYLYYGDRMILEEFYEDMKTWVAFIEGIKEDGIIPHGLGDWCPPGGNKNIDCPVPVSSTAFHIQDVTIMANVSQILGKADEHEYYNDMLNALKRDFNRHFYNTEEGSYGSQTANALALEIGIVPKLEKQRVAQAIVRNIHEQYNGFINTGIFGLARLFEVLAENGQEQEVYRLLSKKDNNSFATMWEHYDATTLWEVLPLNKNEDQAMLYQRSHSHPMQGGYDAWFYSGIAGINPTMKAPGFKKIIFKPYLTQFLETANATYESVYGTIESRWQKNEKQLIWDIKIPAGSEGEIWVPNYKSKVAITINNEPYEIENFKNDFCKAGLLNAGTYQIVVEYQQ